MSAPLLPATDLESSFRLLDNVPVLLYLTLKLTSVECGELVPALDLEAHLLFDFICTPFSPAGRYFSHSVVKAIGPLVWTQF